VLRALAKYAREEVDMRQRVMAQRASTRRSVQIVVVVSVVFVLGLAIFNRGFVQPYSSAVGQLVLAIVCLLFAAGFWWLRKLSKIETPDRFLVHGPERTGQQPFAAGQFQAGGPQGAVGQQVPPGQQGAAGRQSGPYGDAAQQAPGAASAVPGYGAQGRPAVPGQGAGNR
jgi:hypothetical protein